MEKEFYMKVKFPEGKEMDSLQLEQFIYLCLKDRFQVLENEDFETLDVTCTRIENYVKE